MKKIVGAAAIAALASGFAFAEASFNVNYRTSFDLINHKMGSNTNLFVTPSAMQATNDALSFKGKADFGGLELEIDPSVGANSAHAITLVKYNAWINFGDFMFKSGTWDSRAVGRVNKDIGNHSGKFWGEPLKPGLAHKLGTDGLGVDMSQQSNKKMTYMLQYANKDMGLEARGAFTENASTTDYAEKTIATDKDDWSFNNETWFAEVGYKIPDFGRILVNAKTAHKNQAFGAFIEPSILDNLTSLVGFTFERNYDNKSEDDLTAYAMAVDVRVRYAINDQLAVTGMFNWTGGDKVADATAATTTKTAEYASWASLHVRYALNDTFVPFFSTIYSAGKTPGNVTEMKMDSKYSASLRFFPGVEIYNTKSANIITGVVWDVAGFVEGQGINECEKTFSIPVLLKVKF